MPTVSIIIPTYNRADLILDSLNSIFAQNYSDYEIIIVDDGSSDDTARVLTPLVEDKRIKYFRKSNGGESSARNQGILLARGKYIAFLDSDDLFEPQKLEIQVKYLNEHPEVGLVHSGFSKFDNTGRDLGYRNPSWFDGEIYPRILLYWTTLMAVDTVLVPRSVFEVVGLFDESLRMGPDLDMWRRISRKFSFGYIPDILAKVRVHEGNISGNKISATDGFVKYLEKAFEDDPSLSKQFRARVFSRMYSTQAYNLLSEKEDGFLKKARFNAGNSILHNPLNIHGYLALLATLLGYNFRYSIVRFWRRLRSRIMSRNRFL